ISPTTTTPANRSRNPWICSPERLYVSIFFFQAEAGIRDGHVTGVQTCALPISGRGGRTGSDGTRGGVRLCVSGTGSRRETTAGRSEERRVGKEWRSRGGAEVTEKEL